VEGREREEEAAVVGREREEAVVGRASACVGCVCACVCLFPYVAFFTTVLLHMKNSEMLA